MTYYLDDDDEEVPFRPKKALKTKPKKLVLDNDEDEQGNVDRPFREKLADFEERMRKRHEEEERMEAEAAKALVEAVKRDNPFYRVVKGTKRKP